MGQDIPSLQYLHFSSFTGGMAFTILPYLRLGVRNPRPGKAFGLDKSLAVNPGGCSRSLRYHEVEDTALREIPRDDVRDPHIATVTVDQAFGGCQPYSEPARQL